MIVRFFASSCNLAIGPRQTQPLQKGFYIYREYGFAVLSLPHLPSKIPDTKAEVFLK